jgi:hypothetical protein
MVKSTARRYKPNDGWLSVKLPLDVDAKLREMHKKTRLSLTAIVCNGIEREYTKWKVQTRVEDAAP